MNWFWSMYPTECQLHAIFQEHDGRRLGSWGRTGWTTSQCCYGGDCSSPLTDYWPGKQGGIHHYQHLRCWKALHSGYHLFWSPGMHHLHKMDYFQKANSENFYYFTQLLPSSYTEMLHLETDINNFSTICPVKISPTQCAKTLWRIGICL